VLYHYATVAGLNSTFVASYADNAINYYNFE
jgi:hypothetical protein